MKDFLTENHDALLSFRDMSRAIGSRVDYVQGGGGNTSFKLPNGLMAIKASGFCLSDIDINAAYAVLDYKKIASFYHEHAPSDFEDVEKAGAAKVKESSLEIPQLPTLRPSVEAGFHSLLPAYVIHSHSVYANLAACAKEGREIAKKAFEGAEYSVGFVPYTDPGARLTFSIRDELRSVTEKSGKAPAVILMQNHGMIACADSAKEAERIHTDANARLAAYFKITDGSFVKPAIKANGDATFTSATPFLTQLLKDGKYTSDFLLEEPLYPDQLVFLTGTFSSGEKPEIDCCTLDSQSGLVTYRMNEKKALVIEETLCAVLFICETITKNGCHVCTMGEAAKAFIANWESEKYRKSLAGKA